MHVTTRSAYTVHYVINRFMFLSTVTRFQRSRPMGRAPVHRRASLKITRTVRRPITKYTCVILLISCRTQALVATRTESNFFTGLILFLIFLVIRILLFAVAAAHLSRMVRKLCAPRWRLRSHTTVSRVPQQLTG